jgi:electron transfer flavoprotein beta subunit
LARKEYPGGLLAEMEISLPAVLGIQAADEPPRYVAFSKVRQAMQSAQVDEHPVGGLDLNGAPVISRMFQPESGQRAVLLEGDRGEVADRLIEIMRERGIL